MSYASSVLNTNIASMIAQRNLAGAQQSLSTSVERLSSGLRINRAKDDASGMAVATVINSQIKTSSVAYRNVNDAISMMQTAEGAMQEAGSMLLRIKELVTQGSNDSMSKDQYYFLVQEMSQLMQEVANTAGRTSFNGNNLLGNFSTSGSVATGNLAVSGVPATGRTGPWTFMTGAGNDDKVTVELVPIFDDALSASQTNANKGYVNGALKVGALNALYTRVAWLGEPANSPASGEGYKTFATAPGASVSATSFPMLSQKVYGESGGLTLGTTFTKSSTGTGSFSQNFSNLGSLAVPGQGNAAITYTNVSLTKNGKDTGAFASITIGDGTSANAGQLMSVVVTQSGSGFKVGDTVSFDVKKLLGISPNADPAITLDAFTSQGLPTAPTSTKVQGASGVTESATLSSFSALTAGQSLTIGGLTFTASRPTTAAETAAAFESLTNGANSSTIPALPGSSYGTYSGTLTGWSSSAVSGSGSSSSLVFTSVAIGSNVNDLLTSKGVTVTTVDGAAATNELATVSNFPVLTAGQNITIGNLTFTAGSSGTTAAETAAAFAGLANGATTGPSSKGTYTGALTGWSSGAVSSSNELVFTSMSTGNVINNLAVSTGVSLTTTQGSPASTENVIMSGFSALSAGQRLTIGGLTFTASSATTAAETAAAFANLANGATTGPSSKGTYTGTLTGWSSSVVSGSGSSSSLVFTSTQNGNVADLVAEPTATLTTTTAGVAAVNESATLSSFPALTAGQSLTIGGLTFTAGSGGTTAAQTAAAFGSLTNGANSSTIPALPGSSYGTYSGTLTGWSSSAVSGSGSSSSLVFTSVAIGSNVNDLLTSKGVTVTTVDGAAATNELATVSNFPVLTAGQNITIGNLTFTAGSSGTTAAETAAAFAGLANGATTGPSSKGTYTGALTGWSSGAVSSSNELVFTSMSTGNVINNLAVSTGVSLTTTQGSPASTENVIMSGFSALSAGQRLTIGGLTFTASSATTAAETAAAFANLANGATTGPSSKGTYTGTLTGWSSSAVSGSGSSSSLAFTSSATGPVSPLVASPKVSVTGVSQGVSAATESDTLSNFPQLSAGQRLTIGGLTFTAGSSGTTAAETAAAFANLANGATGGLSTKGTYTGTMSGWSSGAVSGSGNSSSLVFTSATSNSNVSDLVTLGGVAAVSPAPIETTELVDARNKSLNDLIDDALMQINSHRSYFGAFYGRFEHNIANLSAQTENLSAALSRVQDADYGAETATLTKVQILQQAATAMLAQANAMPNVILGLLKSS